MRGTNLNEEGSLALQSPVLEIIFPKGKRINHAQKHQDFT